MTFLVLDSAALPVTFLCVGDLFMHCAARVDKLWSCTADDPPLQGHLAHKKHPTPLGSPYGPRHSPAVGS